MNPGAPHRAKVGEVLFFLIEVMEKRVFEAIPWHFVELLLDFQIPILQHSVRRSPLLDRHRSHIHYFFAKESCIAVISCLHKHHTNETHKPSKLRPGLGLQPGRTDGRTDRTLNSKARRQMNR